MILNFINSSITCQEAGIVVVMSLLAEYSGGLVPDRENDVCHHAKDGSGTRQSSGLPVKGTKIQTV